MTKNSRKSKKAGLEAAPVQAQPGAHQRPVVAPVPTQPASPQPPVAARVPAQPATHQAPAATPVPPQPRAQQAPAAATAPRTSRVSLQLVEPGARQVFVAGSFNGWKPEKTPLSNRGDGHWQGDLAVGAGRYEYLFVVDGRWLPDPNAKESVQNPFGGRNSVLTVSE